MPRVARKSFETSFFHVMVQGIKKEYIFNTEIMMKKYIELIESEKEELHLELLAYCVMNNHAHLLIYTEKIEEMSLYMHIINQKFAQFYNYINEGRVGYVFRDRYKSEPIYNEQSLIRCIRYIHNNPVKSNIVKNPKDYKYSSYHQYCDGNIKTKCKIINDIMLDFQLIVGANYQEMKLDDMFMDIEDNPKELIQTKLLEYELENKISLMELIKDKKKLFNFIEGVKQNYKIPYNKIVQEIGLSTRTWRRIKQEMNKGSLSLERTCDRF